MAERESLLKGSVWKTESDERRTTTLTKAKEVRKSAFSDLVILIDDQCEEIAEQHDKPLAGIEAEIAFLTQLRTGLEGNGHRITSLFASPVHSQASAAEIGADDMSQQDSALAAHVRQLEANQTRLQAEAREASDLRTQLQVAERDLAGKDEELDELREQLRQANERLNQPNPLDARVEELGGQLREATADKETAENEVTRIQGELNQANLDKDAAEQSANTWHERAIEAGYVEPGSQPGPEPEPMVGGFQGEDQPAPVHGRRRPSWLPGHGRSQSAQDGGDQ